MQPLRAKGWEMALLEYTLSMLTDSASKPPLTKRLAEISCPGKAIKLFFLAICVILSTLFVSLSSTATL